MFRLQILILLIVKVLAQGYNKHLHQLNLSSSSKTRDNQTLNSSKKYPEGILSPYYVFQYNHQNLLYDTSVEVSMIGGRQKYQVIVDINLPFTILTQKQNHKQVEYVMFSLSWNEQKLVTHYIRPRFPDIDKYIESVFYVIQSTFSVNSQLSFSYSFFFIEGIGAKLLRDAISSEGYLGLGLGKSETLPQLNLVVSLYQQSLLNRLTYSTYYGNQANYVDSVLFLGNYQSNFIEDDGNLTQFNTFNDDYHTWCINITNYSLQSSENIPIWNSNNGISACLDPTFPFLELPSDIIQAVQDQLQSDRTLYCIYQTYEHQGKEYQLLECSSKLPIYELSKYPSIVLNLTDTKQIVFQAVISAENYVYSCWYDVERYMKKCLTLLAQQKNTTNITQISRSFNLGLPFLRTYYSYFDLSYQQLYLVKAHEFIILPTYSSFWYYTLLALLFFWSIVMITCGVYYKEQMNQMMTFVSNIIKYIFGDQEARRQIIIGQLIEEQ